MKSVQNEKSELILGEKSPIVTLNFGAVYSLICCLTIRCVGESMDQCSVYFYEAHNKYTPS